MSLVWPNHLLLIVQIAKAIQIINLCFLAEKMGDSKLMIRVEEH